MIRLGSLLFLVASLAASSLSHASVRLARVVDLVHVSDTHLDCTRSRSGTVTRTTNSTLTLAGSFAAPIMAVWVNDIQAVTFPDLTFAVEGLPLNGSMQGAGGIGGLLARSSGTNHVFYHADGAGNVTALVHPAQPMAGRYSYDPFGNPLASVAFGLSGLARENLYRFSSKELRPSSGLIYYGRRYCDPSLRRWNNRDLTTSPSGQDGRAPH